MFLDIVTGTKIPVGRAARTGFDWLESNATAFFDGVSWLFENLIAAVLLGCNHCIRFWSSQLLPGSVSGCARAKR